VVRLLAALRPIVADLDPRWLDSFIAAHRDSRVACRDLDVTDRDAMAKPLPRASLLLRAIRACDRFGLLFRQ